MTRDMKNVKAEITALITKARVFLEEGDVEKAKKIADEAEELKKSYDLESKLLNLAKQSVPDKSAEPAKKTEEPTDVQKFCDALRTGKITKDMSEGTPADGGYTVPQDIRTRVETLRDSKFSLRQLVKIENVKTNEGRRTFKKRASQTGFTKVGEKSKIGKKDTPQFSILEYKIDKYGGYFPVTDEVLADTDQNLVSILTEWIADESRVTDNTAVLAAIATQTATNLKDIDGIKKCLNVTLGSAFRPTSKIITNDDGFDYLDHLKDTDGDYLLQPSVTNPSEHRLFGVPVVVIPNADMPSDTTTTSGKTIIPFIIGDLKEGIVYFDRKQLSILSSTIASTTDFNAFEQDMTLFRAIQRFDIKVRDDKAFINGTITV